MRVKRNTLLFFLAAFTLVVAGLACGRQAEPTLTPETVVVTATPRELEPDEPTSTPVPGGCSDGMQFLADVTVPDGSVYGPNEPFIKTWRVRNGGTCDWVGYHVVFVDGEPMGTMDQAIPDTPAGEEVEISIEMTAPGGAGSYTGRWQIQSPQGANLGALTCVITVESDGEPPSSEEPTEEPVAEPTEEEPPPPGAPAAPSNLRAPSWSADTITLAWDDNSDDETGFRVRHVGVGWAATVEANVTSVEIPAPPCGETAQYRVRAFNDVGDSEPSNTLSFEGLGCPDLIVENLELSPNPVNAGQEFVVDFDVANHGVGQAGPSTGYWRIFGVAWERTCDVPALDPGQSHHCSFSFLAAPTDAMNYGTQAIADHEGAVAEMNEENNEERLTLQVR